MYITREKNLNRVQVITDESEFILTALETTWPAVSYVETYLYIHLTLFVSDLKLVLNTPGFVSTGLVRTDF